MGEMRKNYIKFFWYFNSIFLNPLGRSEDYYRKMCMIKENEVPLQSEISERLGDNISEILFDTCLPALKPFLGLSPPLEGPGPDLWISPSDLLIGKVKLKPPLTSKHIKALTHQGILGEWIKILYYFFAKIFNGIILFIYDIFDDSVYLCYEQKSEKKYPIFLKFIFQLKMHFD